MKIKQKETLHKAGFSVHFWLLPVICFLFILTGCSDDDDDVSGNGDSDTTELLKRVNYRVIREYTLDDLKTIERDFKADITGISNEFLGLLDLLTLVGSEAKYPGQTQLYAYKVSYEPEETHGFAAEKLSGILLVPPLVEGQTYRQVVAPPYTYVQKEDAPTVRVAEAKLDPHLFFWISTAFRNGYAVILPDYPGFGDSYGQCYIPYMEKELMVRTTAAYVTAVQAVLYKEAYEQKTGLIVSGYSLGAYVSMQLARDYELNPDDPKTAVDLLMVGGSPCDLLHEARLIRASETMPQPYLFPLVLLGYKNNSYPQLVMSDYLQEPYASEAATYLDGQHTDFEDFFPKKTADLFTEAFVRNQGMDEINEILKKNSVVPWINTCKFIMTHGRDDETVYYAQASDFASAHTQNGGTVHFSATSGTHTSAGIWFYLRLYTELSKYK